MARVWERGLPALYLILATWVVLAFEGTGGSGDSEQHFLIARWAPVHPELYLDHWGKPLFTLLASPFAQLGFAGMKAFNALCMLGTLLMTMRLARRWELPHPVLAGLFLLACPGVWELTFSGLTEPLFSLGLVTVVVLAEEDRWRPAALVAGLLPFVRSEGLLVLGVLVCFLVLHRQWRAIPWSAAGHVLFGLAGWPLHGTPFWTFTRIPYAQGATGYGSGEAGHFVEQLLYLTGVPVYILFWVGLLAAVVLVVRHPSWRERLSMPLSFLVVLMAAHSLFWALGIFHSMGLSRVLFPVLPLAALAAAGGLAFLRQGMAGLHPLAGRGLAFLLIGWAVVFPFTPNPAALHVEDLEPTTDQRLMERVAEHLRDGPPGRIAHQHPGLDLALGHDPFDPEQHLGLQPADLEALRPGDRVVWDDWFAVVEAGLHQEALERDPRLELVHSERLLANGRSHQALVFAVR